MSDFALSDVYALLNPLWVSSILTIAMSETRSGNNSKFFAILVYVCSCGEDITD